MDDYKMLGSWVYTCVDAWSPWLFLKADPFTVVDYVKVVVDTEIPSDVATEIKKGLKCDVDDRIVFDENRYNRWKTACNFKFIFESLELHITPEFTYFQDSLERQSQYTFMTKSDLYSSGPVYTTATIGAKTIPWLLCMS